MVQTAQKEAKFDVFEAVLAIKNTYTYIPTFS
jgi:hypothetical protein